MGYYDNPRNRRRGRGYGDYGESRNEREYRSERGYGRDERERGYGQSRGYRERERGYGESRRYERHDNRDRGYERHDNVRGSRDSRDSRDREKAHEKAHEKVHKVESRPTLSVSTPSKQEVKTNHVSRMTFKNKAVTRKAQLGRKIVKGLWEEEEPERMDEKKERVTKKRKVSPARDLDQMLNELEEGEGDKIEETKGTLPELLDDDSSDVIGQAPEVSITTANSLLSDLAKKSKKILPVHALSTDPIEKSLYSQSEFISSLTDAEVSSLRMRDGVIVHGSSIRRPILEWSQLGLPSAISSVLQSFQFDSPTPIQAEALPNVMSGRDFIGIAKTGSGKTLAYLLPLFRHLLANQRASPRALVLVPTRELAIQIHKVALPFLESLNFRSCCCYGGQPISIQIAELKRQCDLVVCTPGRLIDLLCANSGRILSLAGVSYFVLDESDRMFDMGFEPQVMRIVNTCLRKDRQTVLFSATFPPKMETLARKVLLKPYVEVSVGTRNLLSETITQKFVVVDSPSKFARVLSALGEFKAKDPTGKVLLFADTQNGCDSLVKQLAARGYPALCLHGGRDQMDRDSIIRDFAEGTIDIVVATSVASRGLDIEGLNLVINYDAPSHMEDYVHRVGRTGRAGRQGESLTLIMPSEEKAASDIVRLLELSSMEIPSDLRQMSAKFREKVKSGSAKYHSGFGGKGLEKLEKVREEQKKMERAVYEEGKDDKKEEKKESSEPSESVPSLSVEFFDSPESLGAPPFHAKIGINDLPAQIRWKATRADRLAPIIEQTSVSFTTKGRYYPQGKQPGPKDDPKLFLLVESDNKARVREAVAMVQESFIESIKSEEG